MNEHDMQIFKAESKAAVFLPGETEYERLKNSVNRTGNPAMVVQPGDAGQVAEAVAFARRNALTLSVRSGGHGAHGKSTNNGGIVIDMGRMRHIEFAGKTGTVLRVEAGARWGEVAAFLSPHKRAISSGDTNQVGVAGLTLGGGIGWMVRKHGLAIDSLLAVELVTAGGTLLRASADENPDLFWALRGGSGNFGAVTAFEFQTQLEESVFGFEIVYDISARQKLVEAWGVYMRTAPRELSSSLTVFPGIVPVRPEPELRVSSCFAGTETQARQCYEALCGLAQTVSKDFKNIAYADILHDAPPANPVFRAFNRSGFVPRIDAAFAAAVAENSGRPGTSITQIRALGGAMSSVAPEATAFAHRDNEALLITVRVAPAEAAEAQGAAILDGMFAPYKAHTKGAYVNFYNDTGEAALREIYPESTLARLKTIKATYDPENLFNQTHSIVLEAVKV